MNNVTEDRRLSISHVLFGVSSERGNELSDMVSQIMKNHAADHVDETTSPEELATHWQDMFNDMIVEGKNENERLWIAFSFARRYQTYVDAVTRVRENPLEEMLRKLLNG